MKRLILLAAMLLGVFGSGFFWDTGKGDPCTEARNLAFQLVSTDNPHVIAETEQRILTSCPDGPAGLYVKGRQLARSGDREGAMALFREALKSDPGFAPANASLGLAYSEKGMADEAAVELTKGLAGGSNPQLHASLGRIFTDKGLFSLALHHYAEGLRLDPDNVDILAGQGEALAGMGQLDRADEIFRRLLARDEGNQRARQGVAHIRSRRQQPDQTMAALVQEGAATPENTDKAANRLPSGEPVADRAAELLAKGDELFETREYGKAIELYGASLANRPEWPEAQLKLADAYNAAGREEQAITAYLEALRLKAEGPDIHYNLGVLYERKGLLDEAIVEYRQALKLQTTNRDARRRLADIYTLRGSLPQAIEQYREILKTTQNDSPVIRFKLARVLASSKAVPEAVTEYTRSLELDNDNTEAHRELASLFRKQNQLPEAEKHYREVLRLKPDDQEARNAVTASLVKDKRYDELAALLQQGADLDPSDSMARYKLGLVYEYVKKYDDSEAAYQKAIELKSDNAKALNALGRVYMKTGRFQEARQALEAAKAADPELEETDVLLNSIRDELNPEPRKKTARKTKKGKAVKKAKKSTKRTKTTKKKTSPAKKTTTKTSTAKTKKTSTR
jgi:tetratricopeptide (TPR) repeat protein